MLAATTAEELRAILRTAGTDVIIRNEASTGLGPGPQANKLLDELITAFGFESERLHQLHQLELDQAGAGDGDGPAATVDGPLLAPELHIASADMTEVLTAFDNTAPKHHAILARQLLIAARREGAAGDVTSYLTLMADADVVEGVYTVEWPEHRGLPAPGEHVSLGAEFPAAVRGDVQVVGFGRGEGTLRVRPFRAERSELGPGLDDLGPVPEHMGHDAIEELDRDSTPPSPEGVPEVKPLDG